MNAIASTDRGLERAARAVTIPVSFTIERVRMREKLMGMCDTQEKVMGNRDVSGREKPKPRLTLSLAT